LTAILLDQGLPFSTARLLREHVIAAIHVSELGMGESTDEEILATARTLGRVVCTLDSDFHALMALAGASSPSVILIRMQHLKGPAMATLLLRVLARAGLEIGSGALVTATEIGLRIRRLPVLANQAS
jgi:predicted nuclease of predicted toxin-antitoxin system